MEKGNILHVYGVDVPTPDGIYGIFTCDEMNPQSYRIFDNGYVEELTETFARTEFVKHFRGLLESSAKQLENIDAVFVSSHLDRRPAILRTNELAKSIVDCLGD